jgi:hypothetical protein
MSNCSTYLVLCRLVKRGLMNATIDEKFCDDVIYEHENSYETVYGPYITSITGVLLLILLIQNCYYEARRDRFHPLHPLIFKRD